MRPVSPASGFGEFEYTAADFLQLAAGVEVVVLGATGSRDRIDACEKAGTRLDGRRGLVVP